MPSDDALVARLSRAGCVAAEEEARELRAAAGEDDVALEAMACRREAGEPLAWVTGTTTFGGVVIKVAPGVYVPRWQTEVLAQAAIAALAPDGVAVDICTGSGAVAAALHRARPGARVMGTDLDPLACRCAASNGVEVYEGFLADPLPAGVRGRVDVVTAVVPYVPSESLEYLPRDVQAHEPRLALDGGPGGTRLLEAVVGVATGLLRVGGKLLLELGGDQDRRLAPVLAAAGFLPADRLADGDGDLCGIEAELRDPPGGGPTGPR